MVTKNRARIILFPGLGADHRLLQPQCEAFNIEVPRWLEPRLQEPLRSYGQRMAETIDGSRPFYLGGVSFGGMLAMEVARCLTPRGVFLIASCRSGRCIPRSYGMAANVLRFAPAPLMKMMFMTSSLAMDVGCELEAEQRELMWDMLSESSPRLVQWMAAATMDWSAPQLSVPVYHIHGDRDSVIPVHSVRPDCIVPGAGHMLNLTHADEVNRFIAERIEAQSRGAA